MVSGFIEVLNWLLHFLQQKSSGPLVHIGDVPKRAAKKGMSTTLFMTRQLETLRQHSISTPASLDGKHIAFVTAADHSHFNEARDSIASIQKNLPNQRIHFYDMGLRKASIREVSNA